jgi:hypothetical protein
MKIIFLQDYNGRETAMQEHKRGAVVELDFIRAMELIRLGVADEYIEQEKPVKKAKVKDGENA